MSYDSFTKNKKILDKLYGKKVFKKHVFHMDNTEGFHWDDYDIGYIYKYEEDPVFKPNNTQKHFTSISTKTPPSIKLYCSCINPERFKIIKHITTKQSPTISTQTTPQTLTSSIKTTTQTSPSYTQPTTQVYNRFY